MKSSTQDRVEGSTRNIKGKAKEAAGDLADNPRLAREGRADQVEGQVQKKTGEIKKVFGR